MCDYTELIECANILSMKKKCDCNLLGITMTNIYTLALSVIDYIITYMEAHWSIGSAFVCRSRGPRFEYTGLAWISQGTRNESPLDQGVNCKLDIPGRSMLAAHKSRSEIVSPGGPER